MKFVFVLKDVPDVAPDGILPRVVLLLFSWGKRCTSKYSREVNRKNSVEEDCVHNNLQYKGGG